jgi:ActR/RegA family two-component response regulator
MGIQDLPEADKHLIYGLLLKKKRSRTQERRVLSIVRSSLELAAKIEAILKITRAQVLELPASRLEESQGPRRIPDRAPPKKRRKAVLIVDVRAELTTLLKKCSLKRELSFSRIGERFDAIHLIRSLRSRLVIVNENFSAEEEYTRYFEICRAIEPGIKIIFLGGPAHLPEGSPAFRAAARSLAKPLNIERLEESVRELLSIKRDAQTYKAERSR